jgi:hypothetical protein
VKTLNDVMKQLTGDGVEVGTLSLRKKLYFVSLAWGSGPDRLDSTVSDSRVNNCVFVRNEIGRVTISASNIYWHEYGLVFTNRRAAKAKCRELNGGGK